MRIGGGVVDQDIDPAIRFDRARHQLLDGRAVARVRRQRQDLIAGGTHFCCHGVQTRLLAAGEHDFGAGCRVGAARSLRRSRAKRP